MNDDEIAIDELFTAARQATPPPGAATRGWVRFEAAIAAPSAATAAGATTSSLTLGKLALGIAVVAAISVPLAWRSPERSPDHEATASTNPVVAPAMPTASRPAAVAALPEVVVTPAVVVPTVARAAGVGATPRALALAAPPSTATPTPGPATPPTATPADALRLEAELLGRAWVAIRERRAADARALLTEHTRRFPSGALAPERRACEVVAACTAGERDAVVAATRYLAEHAESHLAARVRSGCALADAPTSSRSFE